MSRNRLQELHDAGQSIWLDFIHRGLLRSGELTRRIESDALTGMTSNPTIFDKALSEGTEYDEQIRAAAGDLSSWDLFELVATDDVRTACDVFRPVYERTRGGDGYVSIEVSPGAAHDAEATVAEARRLWRLVDRPNAMVKVPGTDSGMDAVRRLISEGINVNITLLFSREAHARVIEAYLDGLEQRTRLGAPVDGIASVASFFVSRVDTEVDRRLEELAAAATGPRRARIEGLRGRAAIANAKLAYALVRERFAGPRWEALAARGARLQRPLWASTSTKNPAYRDVLYVEELIGPDTVNTMPPATLEAFRDHGEVRRTVDEDLQGARQALDALAEVGISLEDVTDTLLAEGLASFQRSFDSLVADLEEKTRALGRPVAGTR